MKTCGNCNQSKPFTEFYKHHRDGYQSVCKPCKRDIGRIANRQPKRREYNKAMFRKTYERIKAEYYSNPNVRARRACYIDMPSTLISTSPGKVIFKEAGQTACSSNAICGTLPNGSSAGPNDIPAFSTYTIMEQLCVN